MMDVLSELQGYYSMAGTLTMGERKMRFQKLSYEAQEFATDFESLIRQKVSLENIIEKLGKKFSEKGITSLYYTYLKVAGTVEDALVIDAVFEKKVEYMTKLIEREKMRDRFRQSQMEEKYSNENVYFDLDIKSSNSKKMHEKQILEDAEPMFSPKESNNDGKLNTIVLYVFIILTVLLIGFFLAKTIFK
jgi:hypothetical protein